MDKVRFAKDSFELIMLMAMDEDNEWDLVRADQVRVAIREYAKLCVSKLEVKLCCGQEL